MKYKYFIRPKRPGKHYEWEEVTIDEYADLEYIEGFRGKEASAPIPENTSTSFVGKSWEGKSEHPEPEKESPLDATYVLVTEMEPVAYVLVDKYKKRLMDLVELVYDLEDSAVLRGFSTTGFDQWLYDHGVVISAGLGHSTRRAGPNYQAFYELVLSLQTKWLDEQKDV